jgi:GTPase SAR1 family protein
MLPRIRSSLRLQAERRHCHLTEEYTALRDQWIREGDGFLIVYSITQHNTFDRVERFKQQINRVKDSDDIPVVIVGNKSDKGLDREVTTEDGKALARQMRCEFGASISSHVDPLDIQATLMRSPPPGCTSYSRNVSQDAPEP